MTFNHLAFLALGINAVATLAHAWPSKEVVEWAPLAISITLYEFCIRAILLERRNQESEKDH